MIAFPSLRERRDYSERILQRVAIDVGRYSVLNLHRIGIDAPVKYVFEEFFSDDAGSRCWPDHVATQQRSQAGVEEIRVVLMGGMRRLHGVARRVLGDDFGTLFRMRLLRAQSRPDPSDFDNARYLLYSCGGGYPVGILGVYVRSPLPGRGESDTSQVFFLVGFDFYGRHGWSSLHPINRAWEGVHNRVTNNVLNRFKRLCEVRFREFREGLGDALAEQEE